jgi:CMP-N,N'-diacetyllegionaminic acid synthase
MRNERSALIIGWGSIGQRHDEILRSENLVDRVDLVTKRESANRVRYSSVEEVPGIRDYDYYVISSITIKHHEHLAYLCDALDGKTILVEKPLFERSYKLESGGNTVYVGYNMRFEPIIQAMREELIGQEVLFAQIYVGQYLPQWHPWADYRNSYSARRNLGGGVLIDLSHEIDYAQYLFGHIKEFSAISDRISSLEIDTDDLFTCIAISERGILINLTMDYLNTNATRTMLVHTNAASYTADFISNVLTVTTRDVESRTLNFVNGKNDSYLRMHRAALSHDESVICTFAEGLATMNLLDELRQKRVQWRQ